ncbi:alpha/beta hydrolase family protein [Thalassomonas sp. M1454]|uniref:alpha/beta hydrolase family protein n=1 Tax=Thalassomonas sp. M1454 TaxID=2594477 RepID=UPI001180ECE5|nr:hypothetical protein [Thalassomonas sp. M1454]TRX55056.1 hypothetical protein FNN08_10675 [Thalassomonas sp. M1454]
MRTIKALITTVFLSSILLACSEPPVLPKANPLDMSSEQLAQISFIDAGNLTVSAVKNLVINDSKNDREITFNLYYPSTGGNYPLVLFSHGNFASNDKYDNVINHWVSHGYVVIAPNHQDCCGMVSGIMNSLWYGNFGLIEERMKDFSFILDNLSLIAQQQDIKGKADLNNIAATGHSFGAFSAQQFGGAGTYNTDDEQYHYYRDERIKAIVAISPPGPMFDEITEDSWQQVTTPMLVTTGTWDMDASFFPEWQLHKMSFDTAKANDKYALITQGADHYLGNLICRPEREAAPQTDALNMLNATSTAFLNAYLKNDEISLAFINSDKLDRLTNGFSVLKQR